MTGNCCSSGKCQNGSSQTHHTEQQRVISPSLSSESSESSVISTAGSYTNAKASKMSCCRVIDYGSDLENEQQDDPRPRSGSIVPSESIRITFNVEGLKCGCCGDGGISRALEQIPGVQNHSVNVVLARVEFDLNTRRTTVNRTRRRLAAATGYTFTQYFQPQGQILDIIVDNPAELSRAGRPYGVDSIEFSDKSSWSNRILSGRNSVATLFSRPPSPLPPSPPSSIARPNASSGRQTILGREPRGSLLRTQKHVRIEYNARRIGARDVLRYYERLLGQEIRLAPPSSQSNLAAGPQHIIRASLMFLLSALFTIPVLVFAWAPINRNNLIYAHLSLAFASVVQVIAMWGFFPDAGRSVIYARTCNMDFLVALSTTVAYSFSIFSYTREIKGKPLETGSFFETSTLLVSLILLGRVVSEFARSRAAKSVSFRSLQVDEAHLVLPSEHPGDPWTRLIDARLLQYGDVFKVPPETRIVTDGKVMHGGSEVDESMITGEPLPVAKAKGSLVQAGTNNGRGTIIVTLTKLPHENTISNIATLVENAELTKPKAQAIADRIATWFVPVITVIALSVFIIWITVQRYYHHYDTGSAAITAFTYAIATFVVSCPCAIGLAVPMVVLIASGVAARSGIIFRDPQKLETARRVTDVVFDKTGTLTTGNLVVTRETYTNGPGQDVRRMLLGLLEGMKHPVSLAVYKSVYTQEVGQNPIGMNSIQSFPGEGLSGTTQDGRHNIRAGSPSWLGIDMYDLALADTERDCSLLCVTIDGIHRATFLLKCSIRPSATPTIVLLRRHGIRVHMITGDHHGAAYTTAGTLGIPDSLTKPCLKPAQKQEYVDALQADSRTVMFVGDGTNDAAALKAAAVGVHLNQGSDIAKSAADIVLMNPNLLDILVLLEVSRAAYRRIVVNFVWSFVYNSVAVLAASGALRVWRVEPQWAGLGELISVCPVVGVAWSMRWKTYGRRYRGLLV